VNLLLERGERGKGKGGGKFLYFFEGKKRRGDPGKRALHDAVEKKRKKEGEVFPAEREKRKKRRERREGKRTHGGEGGGNHIVRKRSQPKERRRALEKKGKACRIKRREKRGHKS